MCKVLKFGGTSMGSAESMRRVANIACSEETKITVLSAMSGTTDTLVAITEGKNLEYNISFLKEKYTLCVEELFREEGNKLKSKCLIDSALDIIQSSCLDKQIIAQGELLTSAIFTLYLQECGVNAYLLNAPSYIVLNQDSLPIVKDIVNGINLSDDTLYVTQGFICSDGNGELNNLGRGGSDYTAALLGAAIGAEVVQIWTDIDGMHNNDPRYVEGTYPIRSLHFDEAAELAYFGAKILHPATIQPCKEKNIPVVLKNSMDPSSQGTMISNKSISESDFVAIAAKDDIIIIRITSTNMLMAYGFLRKVFEVFEVYRTPIDMIATSEVAISLTIDDDRNLNNIVKDLSAYGQIEVEYDNSIVCIVGRADAKKCGLVARIMNSLVDIPIKMISYGASSRSISFLVDMKDKKQTLNSLNFNLF